MTIICFTVEETISNCSKMSPFRGTTRREEKEGEAADVFLRMGCGVVK